MVRHALEATKARLAAARAAAQAPTEDAFIDAMEANLEEADPRPTAAEVAAAEEANGEVLPDGEQIVNGAVPLA